VQGRRGRCRPTRLVQGVFAEAELSAYPEKVETGFPQRI
jgi:hypothetical protein